MRVLTFTSLFPNAIAPDSGIFIYQRTAHLAERVDLVHVIAPVPYLPKALAKSRRGVFAAVPQTELIGKLQVHHPRYPLLPGLSMPLHGFLMFAGCLARAWSLHRRYHFDCIDAHYVYPDGLAAILIGKALGIPVMVSARGSDIHTFPGFITIRPQIRWVLKRATGLIAVSESLATIMLKLGAASEKLEVIGNGVDSERFFLEDRAEARRKLGFNPGDPVILSVAALRPVKRPELLVRAAALLKRNLPNCKILFVGTGPELAKLQGLAMQLNCDGICRFVGSVPNEELRTYYAAADVTCLVSRNEGWPNVVLESLACGTPVVATRAGAIPDILNFEMGILVEGTPEAICMGLQQAIQQSWDREMLSESAQRHTWDKVAAQVNQALLRCLMGEASVGSAEEPSLPKQVSPPQYR